MVAHEPYPLYYTVGNSRRELYRPIDLAENKRGYRYGRAIADPMFPYKQSYRSTSPRPHYARLSFEDADRWMHFTTNALVTTNERGWRMVRSNVCAREGTLYYEVKIHRGIPSLSAEPSTTSPEDPAAASAPQPHVRMGWARREAPLDAPVGFDGYSYGITDARFEPIHRSRPAKFFHPKPKSKAKNAYKAAVAPPALITLPIQDAEIREGDVIGLELALPSLSLHQKIVSGIYNPAVDIGDGFDQPHPYLEPGAEGIPDVIRDRIPVPYKGNSYFETLDHVSSKSMEVYADRETNLSNLAQSAALVGGGPTVSAANRDALKQAPNPNHENPIMRTLPHSAIRVYKNGKLIGTAFENLLAFLPPASAPSKTMGAREGFDDGMVGYFPAVACFFGGIAEVNFGDSGTGFWCPPAHVANPVLSTKGKGGMESTKVGPDADAGEAVMGVDATGEKKGWNPGRMARAVGGRYKEQVAEDVVWDLVDEVDFFMQDGGYEGTVGGALEGGGV